MKKYQIKSKSEAGLGDQFAGNNSWSCYRIPANAPFTKSDEEPV